MEKQRMCIIGSPLLSIGSLVASSLMVFGWYRANASVNAPTLPGYSWSQHPNVLLVAYKPDNCGCSGSPFDAATEALSRGADVVVLAAHDTPTLKPLYSFSSRRVSVFPNASTELMKRFSLHGETSFTLIRDSRMVRHCEGGVPSEKFWS